MKGWLISTLQRLETFEGRSCVALAPAPVMGPSVAPVSPVGRRGAGTGTVGASKVARRSGKYDKKKNTKKGTQDFWCFWVKISELLCIDMYIYIGI